MGVEEKDLTSVPSQPCRLAELFRQSIHPPSRRSERFSIARYRLLGGRLSCRWARFRLYDLTHPRLGIGGRTIISNAEGNGTLLTVDESSLKNSNSTGLPPTTCNSMRMITPSSSFPSASTGTRFTTAADPSTWL